MQTVLTAYAEQGIKLAIESKRVKHINFRIKSIDEAPFTSLLSVSYPMRMPQHLLMQSLEHRLAWAIDCQQKQRKLKELKPKKPAYINDVKDLANLTLESNIYFEGQQVVLKDLFRTYAKTTEGERNCSRK
ncbi:hypothetical protein [Moraxella osloensis]|uniref:hypothetical protein n=1 Tax=Faucicola osloensis TaxID=34062 RepID=UPI00242B285A|nr:hypothetical protein [Moraxella osloensis]